MMKISNNYFQSIQLPVKAWLYESQNHQLVNPFSNLKMEQLKSTLLPHLLSYMKKYKGPESISSNHLILRIYRSGSQTLTDGFFQIDTLGLSNLERHTFIRVKSWKLEFFIDNLLMHLLDWEVVGLEVMPEYSVRHIKSELQIKALMISSFRIQMRAGITETSMSDILSVVNSLGRQDS
jgi:hypothetical protein